MRVPRLIRFRDMLWTDSTRPTEWWNGVGLLLVGLWMIFWYHAPSLATAVNLWRWVGPEEQGWFLIGLGAAQALSAGTKWVGLRRSAATLGAAVMVYGFVVYLGTAFDALGTLFFGWMATREGWVAWRIIHDRAVNGAERRGKDSDDVVR